MKVIAFVKQKTAKGKNAAWRSNVDRLSSMLVIGTYAFSAYWLYGLAPSITSSFIILMVIFTISSALRLSECLNYNSDFTYYLHLFADILLVIGLCLITKTYAFIPILFALTALGCSGTSIRYVILTAGLSITGILLIDMWISGLTDIFAAFGDSIGTLFNLLIIIGYARIINELFIQRSQLQKQKSQLSEKHEELELAYDALYMSMQEREALAIQEERNRMSGELHDHMGHAMASSLIQLQYIQKVMTKNPDKAQEKLTQIYGHLNQSYEEIRRFVRESQAVHVPQHSLGQLAKRIEELQQFMQLKLTVELSDTAATVNMRADQETHLLRMVQETMTNSLKHGKAQHLLVSIETEGRLGEQNIKITLADDGAGCIDLEPGFGLSSLKNRAVQLGGQLDFESMPAQGFKTTIQLPLTSQEQELAV